MSAADEVTITKGKLRAFMFENYVKGRQDEQDRIIKLLETAEQNWFEEQGQPAASYLLGELIAVIKNPNPENLE